MKQIKTVRHRLDNTCQFDDEVNNLLREGWLLKKRTVLRPFLPGQFNVCTHHAICRTGEGGCR